MRFAVAAALLAPTLSVVSSSSSKAYYNDEKVDAVRTVPSQLSFPGDAALLLDSDRSKNSNNNADQRFFQQKHYSTRIRNITLSNQTLVECKPLILEVSTDEGHDNEEADVGILGSNNDGCPPHKYCAESYNSTLGGICLDMDEYGLDYSSHRYLKKPEILPTSTCLEDSQMMNQQNLTCDCARFNTESEQGYFSCIQPDCLISNQFFCGTTKNIRAISSQSDISTVCIYVPVTENSTDVDSVCYSQGTYDYNTKSICAVQVNKTLCESCTIIYPLIGLDCFQLDCTNIEADLAGNTCDDGPMILKFLFPDAFTGPPSMEPTGNPTKKPTASPTAKPTTPTPTTRRPTNSPTTKPTTMKPTTSAPTTRRPTNSPTAKPTTMKPTTPAPTTRRPTNSPTAKPTTMKPTTAAPTTPRPTNSPTAQPTIVEPTTPAPTTTQPTNSPTAIPSTMEPTTPNPTSMIPTTLEPTQSEPTSTAPPSAKPFSTPMPSNSPVAPPQTPKPSSAPVAPPETPKPSPAPVATPPPQQSQKPSRYPSQTPQTPKPTPIPTTSIPQTPKPSPFPQTPKPSKPPQTPKPSKPPKTSAPTQEIFISNAEPQSSSSSTNKNYNNNSNKAIIGHAISTIIFWFV